MMYDEFGLNVDMAEMVPLAQHEIQQSSLR
jgi:hypothetical protein